MRFFSLSCSWLTLLVAAGAEEATSDPAVLTEQLKEEYNPKPGDVIDWERVKAIEPWMRKGFVTWYPEKPLIMDLDAGRLRSVCTACVYSEIQRYLGPEWGFEPTREFGEVDRRHNSCIHEVTSTYLLAVEKNNSILEEACEASIEAIRKSGGSMDTIAADMVNQNALALALLGEKPVLKVAETILRNGAKMGPYFHGGEHWEGGIVERYCIPAYIPASADEEYITHGSSNSYQYINPVKQPEKNQLSKRTCDWSITNKMIPAIEEKYWKNTKTYLPVAREIRKKLGYPALEADAVNATKTEL